MKAVGDHQCEPQCEMIESPYAWFRLSVALLVSTIGTVGMWSAAVALPAVQADFGIARADASLAFTLSLIGFAFGSALMGRLADRFGIVVTVLCGTGLKTPIPGGRMETRTGKESQPRQQLRLYFYFLTRRNAANWHVT